MQQNTAISISNSYVNVSILIGLFTRFHQLLPTFLRIKTRPVPRNCRTNYNFPRLHCIVDNNNALALPLMSDRRKPWLNCCVHYVPFNGPKENLVSLFTFKQALT